MPPASPQLFACNVPVSAGDIVAEKYVVEAVIGAGGVGVVVSAMHLGLGQRVALKLLQRSALSIDENLPRFEREMRVLARIRSEHVARVMDSGQLPSGEPFMVLEHLEGQDLSQHLKERGKLPLRRAVDILAQACAGVASAHALGVVHRDLKPANLFLAKREDATQVVKVLDFGISKLLRAEGPDAQAVTQTLSVVGSPLYMSPEQMESPRDADERADVWSLGVILYEMLSGKAPFEAPTLPLLCVSICTADPTPLSVHGVEVPAELEGILLRCLKKARDERFSGVAELVHALAPFGDSAAQLAAGLTSRIAEGHGMSNVASEAEPQPESRGRRWSWSTMPPSAARERSRAVPRAVMGLLLSLVFVSAISLHAAFQHQVLIPAASGTGGVLVQARHVADLVLLSQPESLAAPAPPLAPVDESATASAPDGEGAAPSVAAARAPAKRSSAGRRALPPSAKQAEPHDVLAER